MSILREYTRDSHVLVESTKFMRAVFERSLPLKLWYDFVYQKSLFYEVIEDTAEASKFTEDFLDINKQHDLHAECTSQTDTFQYRDATVEYYKYLNTIPIGDRRILAHLYVWHMGDMYGGQMINRVLGINSPSLTFPNRAQLIQKLEQKLDIDLVSEAKVAFEWANKILQSYDADLS
jgi:heme oxygenase